MKPEMTRGSGISWTVCKSFAPHCRQIGLTTPVLHRSVFIGRMPVLFQLLFFSISFSYSFGLQVFPVTI